MGGAAPAYISRHAIRKWVFVVNGYEHALTVIDHSRVAVCLAPFDKPQGLVQGRRNSLLTMRRKNVLAGIESSLDTGSRNQDIIKSVILRAMTL